MESDVKFNLFLIHSNHNFQTKAKLAEFPYMALLGYVVENKRYYLVTFMCLSAELTLISTQG
jgi:hypothetical protein